MPPCLEPRFDILPAAQKEIWASLAPVPDLNFVLYDLMATKLKATLDRAEAKDYRDIAEMISAGVSLSAGLSAFKQMFDGEPAQALRAIGYFQDGDLNTLSAADRVVLCKARDEVGRLPEVLLKPGSLAGC
jgi:hypothetical protein